MDKGIILDFLETTNEVAYWWVDLESDTLCWSEQVFKIHGVSQEEYVPDLVSVAWRF